MKRIFIVWLLGLLAITLWANGKEQILVQLNRQVYINGSYLKYNVYLTSTNPNTTNLSRVVYFEVVNAQNNAVMRWKSRIEGQKLSGQILLPESIENGVYYFKTYTNVMRSYQTTDIGMMPFIIQRIYENPGDSLTITHAAMRGQAPVLPLESAVNITNEPGITHITIQPVAPVKGASISVSVAEKSPFDSLFTQQSKGNPNPATIMDQCCGGEYYTEWGDFAVSGQLVYKATQAPIANQLLFLSTPGDGFYLKYTRTNANGQFCFLIDSTLDNCRIVLQVPEMPNAADSAEWRIDQKDFNWGTTANDLSGSADVLQKDYIYNLQKRELVQRIFNPERMLASQNLRTLNHVNLLNTPNFSIKPDDYEPLNTFQELCDNILTSVRYKKEGNSFKIGITNQRQETQFGNVLMCINGIPIGNFNAIDTLGSADIQRVDIYNSIMLYGDLTFDGVVNIYLKSTPDLKKLLTTPHHIFNNMFYTNTPAPQLKAATPAVAPDLYWNPDITNLSEPLNISIKTPDVGKQFYLNIQGITPDGKFIFYNSNLFLK